jgi:hypothetical protein
MPSAAVEDTAYLTHMCHSDIAFTVHQANKEKGFWPNGTNRDFGQVLALVHGEVSEAYEASWLDSADDKLPHYQGVEVELADVDIRLYDAIGAYVDEDVDVLMDHLLPAAIEIVQGLKYQSLESYLMAIHTQLSRVLEAHRKEIQTEIEIQNHVFSLEPDTTSVEFRAVKLPQYQLELCLALLITQEICRVLNVPLATIRDEKFAFNAKRPVRHGAKY